MNVYELKKLADEWERVHNGGTWPDGVPQTVDEMRKRSTAWQNYREHCAKHFMEGLEGLRAVLNSAECPFCGRDNSNCPICTSDDCPGVRLLAELEGVE